MNKPKNYIADKNDNIYKYYPDMKNYEIEKMNQYDIITDTFADTCIDTSEKFVNYAKSYKPNKQTCKNSMSQIEFDSINCDNNIDFKKIFELCKNKTNSYFYSDKNIELNNYVEKLTKLNIDTVYKYILYLALTDNENNNNFYVLMLIHCKYDDLSIYPNPKNPVNNDKNNPTDNEIDLNILCELIQNDYNPYLIEIFFMNHFCE